MELSGKVVVSEYEVSVARVETDISGKDEASLGGCEVAVVSCDVSNCSVSVVKSVAKNEVLSCSVDITVVDSICTVSDGSNVCVLAT